MTQTKEGRIKSSATRANLSVEEYKKRIQWGLKRCSVCQHWLPLHCFAKDLSRADGHEYRCHKCRSRLHSKKVAAGSPSSWERKWKRRNGWDWCAKCKKWRPIAEIYRGLCRMHKNEYTRHLYASSEEFRFKARQRTYSRKRNIDPITPEIRDRLRELFGDSCVYCGAPATTYDHIVPITKGGQTSIDNIVPCCRFCNPSKGNRDVFSWLEEKQNSTFLPIVYNGMDIMAYFYEISLKSVDAILEDIRPVQLTFYDRGLL